MAVTANGKPARTFYQVLEKLDGCTLLGCRLETGRTHQIRVHMHSIGHPLLGDPVYKGKPDRNIQNVTRLTGFSRQALHAQRLELTHPQDGMRMDWEAPLPDDMQNLLRVLGHQNNQSDLVDTSVSV
jgi:23S rRNA pseudouridine1911/1915/1917 synthase